MSALRYQVVDVFTDRPFAGNPLAVVFGAEDLASEQLQLVAREFNLSETVFVLPATAAGATYRARIFTPAAELPFAGHPSVGAAVTQVRLGLIKAGPVVQECGAGRLPITVGEDGSATLTGGEPTLGPPADPGPLLAAVGLADADGAGPAVRAGCGLEFTFLPVRRDALHRARAPAAGMISVFSWDPPAQCGYARVFCPDLDVPEDPATGSAALGLGVRLVADGRLPGEGTTHYTVRQGHEIGRPSTLDCTVTAADGAAVAATVRGHVVPIASGEMVVPPFVG